MLKAERGEGVQKEIGRPPVLTEDQENELCDLLLEMESRLYGLTPLEVRKVVYKFCLKHNIPNSFNKNKEMAGRWWFVGFLKRHKLLVRQAEATSIQRAIGFNRPKVDLFFTQLKEVLFCDGSVPLPAANIYNVDETGYTICQKVGHVVARNGKHNVGQLTSAEKGKTVTLVCAISATGVFVPPMIIFHRVNVQKSCLDNAPPGSIAGANKSGWITDSLFSKWFDHLLRQFNLINEL